MKSNMSLLILFSKTVEPRRVTVLVAYSADYKVFGTLNWDLDKFKF